MSRRPSTLVGAEAPAARSADPPPSRSVPPASEPAPEPATAAGRGRAAPVCEICGTVMYDRHCKIACPNCGYLRDCSDP